MLGYLKRDGLSVGFKTVQRSLKRLSDLGMVRRCQRFLHRYDHRMWFAPLDAEEQLHSLRPTTIAAKATQTTQQVLPSPARKDTSGPPSKSLSSNPFSSKVFEAGAPPQQPKEKDRVQEGNPTARTAPASPVDGKGVGGESPVLLQETHGHPSAASEVGTSTHAPQSSLVTSQGPLGDPLNHSTAQTPASQTKTTFSGRLGLSGILARCLQMGGYSSVDEWEPPASVSPRMVIQRDGTRWKVDDGVTAPLR